MPSGVIEGVEMSVAAKAVAAVKTVIASVDAGIVAMRNAAIIPTDGDAAVASAIMVVASAITVAAAVASDTFRL